MPLSQDSSARANHSWVPRSFFFFFISIKTDSVGCALARLESNVINMVMVVGGLAVPTEGKPHRRKQLRMLALGVLGVALPTLSSFRRVP